jgi:hypothetical protein
MRIQLPFALVATALVCSVASVPAHARARVFVASYGNDANPCTFGSPCKTFQQAVNVVDPGGEVTAIDSGGFGPINITKAVTITSPDGIEAGIVPVSSGDAITINASPVDTIVLRGLTIDGSSGGNNGIVLRSAASLTVTNCVVKNFAASAGNNSVGNGILFLSSPAFFVITNTIVANNGLAGIYFWPQNGANNVNGVIDHVTATGNISGIAIDTGLTTGGTTGVSITNSVVSNSISAGIYAAGPRGNTSVVIDNSTVGGNHIGVNAQPFANVALSRTLVTGNAIGAFNGVSLYSYGNNEINFNATDIENGLNTTISLR